MGLQGFEKRLERGVEGVFARLFRSGLKPIELGRKLVREMDDNRSVDVRGRKVTVNDFVVRLSPSDHEQFSTVEEALCRELAEAAREHAADEGYHFMGPVRVELAVDDRHRTGTFSIDGQMREGAGGTGAGSLILPGGERVSLGEHPVTVGRLPECSIVFTDKNVSRNHAEVRPHGNGYVVVDLNSTNGTKVNGVKVTEKALVDGDEITFGSTKVRFQAS